MMRNFDFNFVDKTFGDNVQCTVIWNESEFIILTEIEEKITIKRYKSLEHLIKEFVNNYSELNFIKDLVVEQENDIAMLQEQIKHIKN